MTSTLQTTAAETGKARVVAARVIAGVAGLALLFVLLQLLAELFSAEIAAHRTHLSSLLIWAVTLVVAGLVAVAIRPALAPGALRIAIVAMATETVVTVAAARFDPFPVTVLALVAIIGLIGGLHVWRGPWLAKSPLLVLPGLMVVGFASYVWEQFGQQLNGSPLDEHVEGGHYAGMVTVLVSVALAGMLASAPVRGRYFAGTMAGIAAMLLGIGSMITGQVSSLGLTGELALILGGLIFIGQVQMDRLTNEAI
jgi:hypothetical protein